MDKLKPILAQKFWIFFGLVLIMPVVGYFMTKGQLAAQIDTRWKKLDDTFKGIPAGTDSPNQQWIEGLQTLNDKQKLHNRVANEALWRVQKEKMRWPDDIAAVMSQAEYFKPVAGEKGADAQFKYQFDYPRELRRLWEIVDPMDDAQNVRDSDKRRKMSFAMADLQQANTTKWADLPPEFSEIWACQEDIWLQNELLQAIARLNENAISQGDAFIKQLGKIVLFGGSKAAGDAGAATATTGAGADSSGIAMMGMGGSGRKSEANVSVDINLAEEFNASIEAGGSGNQQGGGSFITATTADAGSGSGGGNVGGAPKSDVKRYIDDDENQPYKRRGFSIRLVMDHRKVPDLIAELMNSPFPVEIIRIHQVSLSDGATPSGGGSPFSPGGSTPFAGFGGGSTATAGDATAFAGPPAGFEDSGSGASPFGGSGTSSNFGRPTAGSPGSAAALADPNLAQVAILGVWTLYRPPPAAEPGQPAPAQPTPSVTDPAATTGNGTAAGSSGEAPAPEAKPAAEPKEPTSDEAKKADDPEAPRPESGNAEKNESEPNKPAADQPTSNENATEKSDSEMK